MFTLTFEYMNAMKSEQHNRTFNSIYPGDEQTIEGQTRQGCGHALGVQATRRRKELRWHKNRLAS